MESLAAGERTSDRLQPRRAYNVLVCAETAIATILLCGAGSLVNSFIQLEGVDPGFQPQQVLAITVSHPEPLERSSDAAIFYREVISGMRSVRGFRQVARVSYLPARKGSALTILPVNPAGGSSRNVHAGATPVSITPGYFGTMRFPFLRGRDFNEFDRSGASPVAIVNETLSRQLWPGQEAVGHRLTIGGVGPVTIVGVVGSVRFLGPAQEPIAELYRPYTQWAPDAFSFVIRTDGPPDRYAATARATLHRIAPNQPITQIASMDDYVGRQLRRPRSLATMISAFALLGFALAALGIYRLVSYAAERRTREFGIRLALGAEPREILLTSATGAVYSVLGGLILGAAMSVSADRILRSELYQARATDPVLLWTVAGLLIGTAVLSGLLASRKVVSIDPAEVLRHE
jgi:putative ABC transport system permease protein